VTPESERYYVDSVSNRGSLKLAVFVNLVAGIWMKELTGTKLSGPALNKGYQTRQGKQAKGMTKQEYMDCVREARDHFQASSSAFRRLGSNIYLVHDKCRTHPSQPIPGVAWTPVAHPPHSPDLMPLDYGIFGAAKLELDRRATRAMPWEEKAALFKKILQEAPLEATIKAFRSRLMACIDAGGKHFKPPRGRAQSR
jgi:hypothetical protein